MKEDKNNLIRSSSVEYLTFIAATGDSELEKDSVVRNFRITAQDVKK